MNINISPEEVMRMQETLIEVRVQNALLRDEMARVILERDNLRAQVMATHLKELVQPTDFGRVVPVLLSKIPRVLSELENMGQVRLVMCAMLQMLPDNVPAELVKLVTDAAPRKVQGKPLVQIEQEKGGDIIGEGGTKNINNYGQEPEKGDKAV